MSVGKTALWKRLSISVLLMLLVLLVVNGVCALLMSGGIVDHHMTTQGACAAWGIAAMAAASVARVRDAAVYERWLAPLIILILVFSVSLVLRRGNYDGGLWWKCSISAIIGVVMSSLLVSKKRKKYTSGGGKRKKAKRR